MGARKATIQKGRERFANKLFLAHLEKAANRYETWIEARSLGHINAMRQFAQQMRAQVGKAAQEPGVWIWTKVRKIASTCSNANSKPSK